LIDLVEKQTDDLFERLFPEGKEKLHAAYMKELMELQAEMLKEEQVYLPLVHEFTPGIYMRTIHMKAGTRVIGKTHKTTHFNIIHAGRANVMIDGKWEEMKGPDMFVSGCEVKKVLYILEDMAWSTVHHIEDDWLVMDGDTIDIEKSVEVLEPLMVCSAEEELQLVQTELERLS